MRRRIRRQSPLTAQTRHHAENLLSVSIPPQMQAVLVQLQDNLHNVSSLIDSQLQQTRELSVLAYQQLNATDAPANAATVITPAPPPAGPDRPTSAAAAAPAQPPAFSGLNERQQLLNQQINQKIATLTEQIAARTRQVSAQAEQVTQQAQAPTAAGHH